MGCRDLGVRMQVERFMVQGHCYVITVEGVEWRVEGGGLKSYQDRSRSRSGR